MQNCSNANALIQICNNEFIQELKQKLEPGFKEFQKLSIGNKSKASERLYLENNLLHELGEYAVEVIGELDEELELNKKRSDILKKELENVQAYDEDKINESLNKSLIANSSKYNKDNRDRAKMRLMNKINKNYLPRKTKYK